MELLKIAKTCRTFSEFSEKLGVPKEKLRYSLFKSGIYPTIKKTIRENQWLHQKEDLRKLAQECSSMQDIATKLGITRERVRQLLHSRKIYNELMPILKENKRKYDIDDGPGILHIYFLNDPQKRHYYTESKNLYKHLSYLYSRLKKNSFHNKQLQQLCNEYGIKNLKYEGIKEKNEEKRRMMLRSFLLANKNLNYFIPLKDKQDLIEKNRE